jgi:hypothetical protein
MKTLLITLALLFVVTSSANAASKLISSKNYIVPINVGKAKLKFSKLGYGDTYFVKIIIPELAGVTLMNHRNVGEDGPCLFTTGTRVVGDVLQNRPEIIDSKVNIKLTKKNQISGGRCFFTLREDITTTVRGFKFNHTRTINLPSRVLIDCI